MDDLAWGILKIMDLEREGVYHLSGPEMSSIIDLAIETARFFGLDTDLISPIRSAELNEAGKRPSKTGFVLDKARNDLGYRPKDFRHGLIVVQNLLEELL